MLTRRVLIVALVAAGAAACVRPSERRDQAPPPPTTDETTAWNAQALPLLTETLASLRVCDTYAAYRVSVSAHGSDDPIWDPPTSSEWALAQQQAGGLRQRADQLLQTIANAHVDASMWRERRALAAGAHDLVEATDALRAYLDRANHFAPDGDGSGGLDLLKTAWSHWDAAARAWGLDRAEHIGCGQA